MDISYRDAAVKKRYSRVDGEVLSRLRKTCEVWSAVVYWTRDEPADSMEMERNLRVIRDLGFQAVRFHELQPIYHGAGVWDHSKAEAWFSAAERAGIKVILCGEVFDHPPGKLLDEHGVARKAFDTSWFDEPEHQAVIRAYAEAYIGPLRGRAIAWCVKGEPHPAKVDLSDPADRAAFAVWLEKKYGMLNKLNEAWRIYKGEEVATSWDAAAFLGDPAIDGLINGTANANKRYGALHDFARYKADRENARARVIARIISEIDPNGVIGIGSHQLFVNQPQLGWDIGEWAHIGNLHTTSIHLAWHFETVRGEVDIPVWLQARMTRDALKSGFTSAFETTGGAVQFSGGYGNHMDRGLMRRLCLAYLAAGNQAMAFWTWNCRPGGWEQGEYGMTGYSGKPMPWAEEAGRIARAMEEFRCEIWEEAPTASVGIVESWDTDAVLNGEPERHDGSDGIPGKLHGGVAGFHRRALIGAGRALTNAQIDFEYVTTAELHSGLAGCYDALVFPWHRAVNPSLFPLLLEYVNAGGRLVADLQFGFCDPAGRMLPHGRGTQLETLFGGWVEMIHDGRTGGPGWEGAPVEGFWADLCVTSATVSALFDDGRPAVLRHRIGKGETLLCALDPARAALRPGSGWAGTLIAGMARSSEPDWSCSLPQTVRRRCAAADHYFMHNPGPACTAQIISSAKYTKVDDVLEEQSISGGSAIQVQIPAASASWIRCEL